MTSFNYEIVVIDDGIGQFFKFNKSFKEKTRFYSIKNSGIEKASNFGINKCKGEYITRLDADDYLKPNFVQSNLKLIKNSKAKFVYSNYDAVNNEDDILWKMKLPNFDKAEILKEEIFLRLEQFT